MDSVTPLIAGRWWFTISRSYRSQLASWSVSKRSFDGNLTASSSFPGDFIPIAEETGMILPIGIWVMQTACRQLHQWNKRFSTEPSLSISINVSRKQLADPELVRHLAWLLHETGLNPKDVRLEITESAMIYDTLATAETLARIKATGVKLSMDDWGTGYSSLSCLHQFPIDVLKVDRSFVQAIEGHRNAAGVVRAIVVLAHNLGMEVVAEGLETEEQVSFLKAIECDLGQGFLFSKPLSLEAAENFIASRTTRTPAAA